MTPWDRKKYYRLAKGFYGRNKNCRRTMVPRVEKSLVYSYRDRKVRRRIARKDWIISINAAVREHNLNYSSFIYGLNRSNIMLDRKILSNLAKYEPYSFKAVVDEIKLVPNIRLKPEEEMSYKEAIQKGYIVEGHIQGQSQTEFVPNMFRERAKLSQEQVQKIKSV